MESHGGLLFWVGKDSNLKGISNQTSGRLDDVGQETDILRDYYQCYFFKLKLFLFSTDQKNKK